MARVRLDPEGLARVHDEAASITRRVTEAVARDARRRVPVDTGELLESIHEEHRGREGRVYVGTDHWQPTEYGSGAHTIESTGTWPLRNRETGEVFGRKVRHPGTPEQPFMRPALYTKRRVS